MSVSRLLIPVTQSVCIKQQKYIKQNEKNKAYDLKKKKNYNRWNKAETIKTEVGKFQVFWAQRNKWVKF